MPRKLALATLAAVALAAAPNARASMGFGLEGGLFTPTNNAKNLINSEWEAGLRLLLPAVTPFGIISVEGLNLDVGVDLGVGAMRSLSSNNLASQMLNVSAIYRYTVPFGSNVFVYLGLGGRMTAAWGDLSKAYVDGSLFGHLQGEMSVDGGVSYALIPTTLLDLRAGYGLFGFTSWEVTAGLIFAM